MNFTLAFQACLVALAALWCFHKIKGLLISSTLTISREIEHGENAVFHVNFYVFETQEMRIKKYFKHVGIGEQRKDFCFSRFQQTIREAQEENKKKKLQEVKS
jgi:hypothetical protein